MSRMNPLFRRALTSSLFLFSCLLANPSPAQTLTVLHYFLGPEGQFPTFGVVRDSAGDLYGTTQYGGLWLNCDNEVGGGAVYKVDPTGNTTLVHAFNNGRDGCFPTGTLVMDNSGNLYGATVSSSLFKVNAAGALTTIFQATSQSQGVEPLGTLFRDSQGNFYGTMITGGKQGCQFNLGCGTVFKVQPPGKLKVLYSFMGGADGYYPQAGVVRDASGSLYGTATYGGDLGCAMGCGVVFKLDPVGNLTVLHAFTGGADGQWPTSGLVLDPAGNVYGLTSGGGSPSCNPPDGCGTVYKITPSGKKTVFYAFKGGTDGMFPSGTLTRDVTGTFYGTTAQGGDANNDGTIYKLDPFGRETILYHFHYYDGSSPKAGVILDDAGNLYGTTQFGGHLDQGVVFKLTP